MNINCMQILSQIGQASVSGVGDMNESYRLTHLKQAGHCVLPLSQHRWALVNSAGGGRASSDKIRAKPAEKVFCQQHRVDSSCSLHLFYAMHVSPVCTAPFPSDAVSFGSQLRMSGAWNQGNEPGSRVLAPAC